MARALSSDSELEVPSILNLHRHMNTGNSQGVRPIFYAEQIRRQSLFMWLGLVESFAGPGDAAEDVAFMELVRFNF